MTMSLTDVSLFDNLSWFERLYRKFTLNFISQLKHGDITLVEGNQRLRLGDEQAALKVVITVVDPAFYQKMVVAGSVGAGSLHATKKLKLRLEISNGLLNIEVTAITCCKSKNKFVTYSARLQVTPKPPSLAKQ